MRAKQPYWQNYWFDLSFREHGTPAFLPMGREGPQPFSNKSLAAVSLEELVERLLESCVDDLDDLRGELRIHVYTEANPGPNTEAVMVRTIQLGRP
jgi:hypothetical protein